jgi:hypothetical protein
MLPTELNAQSTLQIESDLILSAVLAGYSAQLATSATVSVQQSRQTLWLQTLWPEIFASGCDPHRLTRLATSGGNTAHNFQGQTSFYLEMTRVTWKNFQRLQRHKIGGGNLIYQNNVFRLSVSRFERESSSLSDILSSRIFWRKECSCTVANSDNLEKK